MAELDANKMAAQVFWASAIGCLLFFLVGLFITLQ